MLKRKFYGEFRIVENVEQVLLDKNGKAKLLFKENFLGKLILFTIRKFINDPINELGQVKKGLFNYISAYGIQIPYLTGTYGYSRLIHNAITDAGRASVASRINGNGGEAVYASIGQGTGITGAVAGDTALGTEVKADGTGAVGVHAIAAATATRVTTTVANDTAQFVGTVSETATIAITESGVFNATTNGTLLARQTFSAVNVVNGDSLQFTWKIKCA